MAWTRRASAKRRVKVSLGKGEEAMGISLFLTVLLQCVILGSWGIGKWNEFLGENEVGLQFNGFIKMSVMAYKKEKELFVLCNDPNAFEFMPIFVGKEASWLFPLFQMPMFGSFTRVTVAFIRGPAHTLDCVCVILHKLDSAQLFKNQDFQNVQTINPYFSR